MPCSNNLYLVCCGDPSIAIQPCYPKIDGVPFSSFISGTTYTTNPNNFYSTICWEATDTFTGITSNYQFPEYFVYTGSPSECGQCFNDFGGGCISATTIFSGATLFKCSNPEIQINVDIPIGFITSGVTFVVSGQCYSILQYDNTEYGEQYYPQYDGCEPCDLDFPTQYSFSGCCVYVDEFAGPGSILFNLDSVPTGLTNGDTVYVETSFYSGCAVNIPYDSSYEPDLYSATTIFVDCDDCLTGAPTTQCYINALWESCCDTGVTITLTTNISAGFQPGSSVAYNSNCYNYTGILSYDSPIGNTDDIDFSDYFNDCGECELTYPCAVTPTPTPTLTPSPTLTPTNTPTPTVTSTETPTPTPTVTATETPTNTPTPSVTPSSSGPPVSGDLNVTFTLTGECYNNIFTANSGQTELFPTGGIPPYSVECETNPSIPSQTGIPSGGSAVFTGLSADTYTFKVTDSSGGVNDFVLVNVLVDDCFNAGLINVTDTTCNNSNGSFEVSVDTNSYPLSVDLYLDSGAGYNFYNNYTLTTIGSFITDLPQGDYYADVTDFGGASATTISSPVTISGSTPLTYTLVVTNNSNCGTPTGKVEVSGLTPGSYTYLWSNGGTTDQITGLTNGTYSVTVTDVYGCQVTQSAQVLNESNFSLVSLTSTQPGCLISDGTVTVTVSGGTGPFYYSGSTGESNFSASTSYTFTGVPAGTLGILIEDANLCQIITSTVLVGGGGLSSVSITEIPTNCGSSKNVDIFANGIPPFTYYYSGATVGPASFVTNSTNYTIPNLPQGSYNIIVSAGTCSYLTSLNITTTPKFSVSATTTGSTCGSSNGSVLVEVGTGYTGVLDYVLSSGQSVIDVNLSSYTFNNLAAGSYVITVTDQDGCFISEEFDITTTGDFGYLLTTTNCVLGDDGTASVNVFAGEPPFTYAWSNGESTQNVTGLTGGTYSVLVTDNNGCFEEKFFTIICTSQQVTNYNIVPVCDDLFTTTVGGKRGMLEMLNEGFLENIPVGATTCTLNEAIFSCNIQISGYSGMSQWVSGSTVPFYTGTSLNDVPSDQLWIQTIGSILNGIPEIENYNIDPLTNSVKIFSDCSGDEDPLRNGYIDINLEIDYDISCVNY